MASQQTKNWHEEEQPGQTQVEFCLEREGKNEDILNQCQSVRLDIYIYIRLGWLKQNHHKKLKGFAACIYQAINATLLFKSQYIKHSETFTVHCSLYAFCKSSHADFIKVRDQNEQVACHLKCTGRITSRSVSLLLIQVFN